MVKASRVKMALGAGLLVLAGCASRPVATATSLSPGIPAAASTFAIVPPADEGARALAPHVEARLQQLGYRSSPNPDLLVELGASARKRGVGAYAPDGCGANAWREPPQPARLIGGGRVLAAELRIRDARSGTLLHRATAHLRTNGTQIEARAAELAAAALAEDPREAPVATPASC